MPSSNSGSSHRSASVHANSSAFSASANPNEDWTKISDLAERRRIQNRIAQRNYRKKLKKRLEDLERRAPSSSPEPERRPARRPLANVAQNKRPRASPPSSLVRESHSPEPCFMQPLSLQDSLVSVTSSQQMPTPPAQPSFSFSPYSAPDSTPTAFPYNGNYRSYSMPPTDVSTYGTYLSVKLASASPGYTLEDPRLMDAQAYSPFSQPSPGYDDMNPGLGMSFSHDSGSDLYPTDPFTPPLSDFDSFEANTSDAYSNFDAYDATGGIFLDSMDSPPESWDLFPTTPATSMSTTPSMCYAL